MSRPLRVVSICRTLPTPDDPAAGIFVLQRLAAMQQLVELTVLQPIPYFPGIKRMPAWSRVRSHRVGSVDINHVPMLYVPGVLKRADGAWLAAAIEPQVAALHRERPLDLIDAHFGFPDGVGASRVAARLGLPVFVTIRGNETEWVANAAVRGQLARALADATGCIAVSQFMRDVAVDLGTEASAIRVIANAVDEKIFHAGDRKDARRRLGLEDHVPLLVSVGNLIQRKRQHVLIEAFAEAKRRIPDASLVMIGSDLQEPGYAQSLRRTITVRGLDGSVRFAGNLAPDMVAVWLRAADLFVLPTAREGCCNAILEALASGLPVVTTPVGDNARFVVDGTNGLIVPVDDVAGFAEAMVRGLAQLAWDPLQISRNLQVGQWDSVARQVVTFFEEQLQRAPRRQGQRAAGQLPIKRWS